MLTIFGSLFSILVNCTLFTNPSSMRYNILMAKELTIIGAGPAGMTAALFAARAGAQVTLIDGNAAVGRKLLVSGAGRANLTNHQLSASRYACADIPWLESVLTRFGYAELISFFESIGVLTYCTPDGWCYPRSESAQTVVDAFAAALEESGVRLLLDHKVTSMRNVSGGFEIAFKTQRPLACAALLVAAGGAAYPTLGSRGQLFPMLQALGHSIVPPRPALAPLTCDMTPWRALTGMRLDATVRLFAGSQLLAETSGNLIFTAWGLNGPAVMDLSHHVSARTDAPLRLELNPLFASEGALRALLREKRHSATPLSVLLGAVLPPKLPPLVLERLGFRADVRMNEVSDKTLPDLFALLTALPFTVRGVRGFEYCQVSAGGVPLSEVDPLTMRSRLLPGLQLAGEMLDVTGPCGGYNLHFAFASGALAGMST